jgi:cholesterol oxidase
LGFVYGAKQGSNGASRALDASGAPVITSAIRLGDNEDGELGRGMYLQDAGYPEWVNWVVEMLDVAGNLKRAGRFAIARGKALVTRDPDTDLASDLAQLLGDGHGSHASMPLLGMGRDTPDGNMSLRTARDGRTYLALDWSDRGSEEHYTRVRDTARRVSEALGGEYIENPLSQYFNRQVTVHPLGGCPMGRHPKEGVVDEWGQVFGCPGLYVADGAVMPGPVGANPSLTIAALSNRFADRILAPRTGASR